MGARTSIRAPEMFAETPDAIAVAAHRDAAFGHDAARRGVARRGAERHEGKTSWRMEDERRVACPRDNVMGELNMVELWDAQDCC